MDSSEDNLDEIIVTLSASFKEDLRNVLNLWERMGLSAAQVKQRHETVIAQLTNVTKSMVEEETKNEVKLMNVCSKHLDNIASLWSELEGDGEALDKDAIGLPLVRREKYLRDKFDLLNKEKTRRLAEERILIKENYDLSTLLGVQCVSVVENTLLTENERIELENHIGDLKEMKEERETYMLNIKEEIVRLLDQLEIDLNTTSLADFITEDESKSLSQSDLKSLQVSMEELQKQLEEKQRGAEMIVQEIFSLYEKLKISENQRLPLTTGQVCPISELHKSEHLPQLEEELRVLKVQKRKQIKILIENAREELHELWEKCMTPVEDREEILIRAEDYTEDTLEELENKIKTMKVFFDSNYEVFSKYKKLLSLWDTVEDLDAKSRDPNRLLKSRGNALFKEEKERKQIGHLLPKIEQELLILAEKKDADSDEVLTIGKVPIVDIIENLRAKHAHQLKNISLDRRVSNKPTIEATAHNNNKSNKSKTFMSSSLAKLRSTKKLGTLSTSPGRRPNSPIAANLQRSYSRISPLTFSPARTRIPAGTGSPARTRIPEGTAASTRTLKVPPIKNNFDSEEDLSFHADATSVMSSTMIGNKSVFPNKSPVFSSRSPVGDTSTGSNIGVKKSRFGFSFKRRSVSLAEDTPTSRNNGRKGEPSKLFHGGSGGKVTKGLARSDSTRSITSLSSTSGRSSTFGRRMAGLESTSGSTNDSTFSYIRGSSGRIKNTSTASQASSRGTGLPTRNNSTVSLTKGPILR